MKHIKKTKRQYFVYDKTNQLIGTWGNPTDLIKDLKISTSSLLYKSIKDGCYIKNNILEKIEYKILLNKEKVIFEIETQRKPKNDFSTYHKQIRTYIDEIPSDAKKVDYIEGLYIQPNGTIIGTDENGYYLITPYLNKYKGVKKGYYKFHYNRKIFRVHYLLAKLFVPGYKPGLTVDHINNDSTDNRLENLQWISRGANAEKFWNSLSDEEYADFKIKYSEGLKRAHAEGKYDKHLDEVHKKIKFDENHRITKGE